MRREAVVVMTDDAQVLADLVRIGCAALAAVPIASTAVVPAARRARQLRIGQAFLDEIDAEDDDT